MTDEEREAIIDIIKGQIDIRPSSGDPSVGLPYGYEVYKGNAVVDLSQVELEVLPLKISFNHGECRVVASLYTFLLGKALYTVEIQD